jgi:hypothetical protein
MQAKVITDVGVLKGGGVFSVDGFLTDFAMFYHYEMDGLVFSNFVKFKGFISGGGRVSLFVYYKVYDEFLKEKVEEMVHFSFSNSDLKSNFEFYMHREDLVALYTYLNNLWDDGIEYVKFKIEDHYLIVNNDFKVCLYN